MFTRTSTGPYSSLAARTSDSHPSGNEMSTGTAIACPPAARSITVDGSLDDWATLPYVAEGRPLPVGSPEGTWFRFGVAHDEDFLYVAVEVTDPTPFSSEQRTSRDQDAIVIEVDARPEEQRAANEGFLPALRNGSVADLMIAWLTPAPTRRDAILAVSLPELPEGTRRAERTTDSG